MKERPILFSGPMVRAILDGRKSQTRRVVNPPRIVCDNGHPMLFDPSRAWADYMRFDWQYLHVPFAHPGDGWQKDPRDDTSRRLYPKWEIGDRLWVREAFIPCRMGAVACKISEATYVCYRDGWQKMRESGNVHEWTGQAGPTWETGYHLFSPSIHMPRWASRITLEVTAVRVETIQSICDGDAIAEGISLSTPLPPEPRPYLHLFRELWDSINGKRHGCAWIDNPWVWAINFKLLAPNPSPLTPIPSQT